jgi:hypothetical protein
MRKLRHAAAAVHVSGPWSRRMWSTGAFTRLACPDRCRQDATKSHDAWPLWFRIRHCTAPTEYCQVQGTRSARERTRREATTTGWDMAEKRKDQKNGCLDGQIFPSSQRTANGPIMHTRHGGAWMHLPGATHLCLGASCLSFSSSVADALVEPSEAIHAICVFRALCRRCHANTHSRALLIKELALAWLPGEARALTGHYEI